MVIPQGFIQELLSRADIVDVIGRYMTLKKTGANFKGLCPFHGEKTPSFVVSPVRQTYHCFGCGAHGDALRFLMEHNGLGFVEAIKDLAQQLGLKVPQEQVSVQEKAALDEHKRKQSQLTGLLEQAARYWAQVLGKNQRAQSYLQRRGLSQEVITRFELGYATSAWNDLQQVFTNYDDPLLVTCGLVIVREDSHTPNEEFRRYDRFRDRIMFPIRNIKGEVIGFGGRILDKGEPKYLNSPETPVFHKGQELYGLYEARHDIRKSGYALVTEGYMDVVALWQHGFANAVATLGTACTPEHVQKIFKLTEGIVFSFDGDAAGRKAARRALEASLPYARDTRSIKFLFLPQEHDPDSFIREKGHDAFTQYINASLPLSQFLLEAVGEGCDLTTAEGRARMLAQAHPLWMQLPSSEALSLQLLGEIARHAQMTPESLQTLWAQQAEQAARYAKKPGSYQESVATVSDVYEPGASELPAKAHSPETNSSFFSRKKKNFRSLSALAPARAPLTPSDQCIRMLLIHSEWWEHISVADQELLCAQPGWQGECFRWIERVLVDAGSQSWAVLSEMARSESWYDMMQVLMDSMMLDMEIKQEELNACLHRIRTAKQQEENARILQQFKNR